MPLTYPKVLVITGPTGIGKSSFAIELAKKLNGEILNGDSVQVYFGFDIGSAKLALVEQEGVAHHLLSYIDPRETFDAARFTRDATEKINFLNRINKMPIVCGGTGLYLRSLLCGMADVPEVTSAARIELNKREAGVDEVNLKPVLFSWLSELDPLAAKNIDCSDLQRIRRALLVYLSSGVSLFSYQSEHQHKSAKFHALVLILKMDKEPLNRRINARVKEMINSGLINEVKRLLAIYPLKSHAFNAIGYRHAVEFLRSDYDFEKMIELLKRDTRHFAKRQRTWWRNQPRMLDWKFLGSKRFNRKEDLSTTSLSGSSIAGDICVSSISELVELVAKYFADENTFLNDGESKPIVSYLELEV